MIQRIFIANKAKYEWLGISLAAILYFPTACLAQTAPNSEQAPPPTVAPTPEHVPAQLPAVTFRNGELTIVAYNSTLRDILEMVRTQTGATMEIPPEATERVFVTLGPGPTHRVLDSLLAGSRFNYVLLGSASDSQALTKVVLIPKPSGSADNGTVAEVTPAAQRRLDRHLAQNQGQTTEETEAAAAPIQQGADTVAAEESPANTATKADNANKSEGRDKTEVGSDVGSQPSAQLSADNAQPPAEYPRTPNIKTAQEVLQDLYARRQAMQQQQRQTTPQ